MLEETGRVVDVDDDGVWVETIKQSACASCAAQSGCGQKLLASIGQGKRSVICVNNPEHLNVAAEDNVVIGIAENAFMRISFLIYMLPLLALFLGAALASSLGLGEPAVIGSGLAGLGVGLVIVRFISRTYMTTRKYHPVLLKVI